MTYLLANGNSATAKNFASTYRFGNSDEDKKKLGIPLGDWPMWPELVSKKLGLPVVNIAKNGASNQLIYRTTIEQVEQVEKPKVIMTYWTVGFSSNFLNFTFWDHTYIIPLELANNLLNHDSEAVISVGTSKSWSNYRLAFHLINYYYPEKYEKCKAFYVDLCKDHNLHAIENIITDGFWWAERVSPFFFCAYYLDLYQSSDELLKEKVKNKINEELEPILRLYELCEREKIQSLNVIDYAVTDGRRVVEPYYEMKEINTDSPNIFESMLIGTSRMLNYITSNWTNNYYYKKLEKLIYDKKYTVHNWPSIPDLTSKKKRYGSWLEGWKPISDQDDHPHPDTHKLLADFFCDLYKKNYGGT